MDFDKSRVYTAVNADELKIGSKIVVADSLCGLEKRVEEDNVRTLTGVRDYDYMCRFEADSLSVYNLAYLVSEPEEKKLKWTDLKIGDVIRKGIETYMVIGIEDNYNGTHILAGQGWLSDKELEEWEKVE